MSQSDKCKDNLNFSAHYGAAEKNEALLEGKKIQILDGL